MPLNSGQTRIFKQRGLIVSPMLLLFALVAAVVLYVVFSNRNVAEGPVPVVWDKTACAFCSMHLGDPRFAAQLTMEDGTTYFYDDPGCLFSHQASLAAPNHQIYARWFRDFNQDAWLSDSDVFFQRCEDTPMNFGFAAIDASGPATFSLDEAVMEVLAR